MATILVINTGSTSTKIAVFENKKKCFEHSIVHNEKAFASCAELADQCPLRSADIAALLRVEGYGETKFDAVAARGGTFGFAKGGGYLVDEKLKEACRHPVTNHASNLSALIADDFASRSGCSAYIYDAVCTKELWPIAEFTGLKDVQRRPFSHVLNTRATARQLAEEQGKKYEDMNFIVAHMGGGFSINLHIGGRIVDLCCDDEGPMSPERAGKLNGKSYVDICFSGKYDKKSVMRLINGQGGLVSHLCTNSMIKVDKMIDSGNTYADEILSVMAYQTAKEIGALACAADGKVDSIVLTGGCAYSKHLTNRITKHVQWIAPVTMKPGAMEMEALAAGVLRILNGEESYHIFGK